MAINYSNIFDEIDEYINFKYYLEPIFNIIKNNIDENSLFFNFQYLEQDNHNIIYFNCKIKHIIDFGIVTISFNYEFNEYVLSLILYNIENKKTKNIDMKILSVDSDSKKIIKALCTISEYILYDYLYVRLSQKNSFF